MIKIIICINILFSIVLADDSLCLGQPPGTLINDPVACDAFFFCLQDVALSANCPVGQYFNPDINNCDDSENVNCVDQNLCPEVGVHVVDHPQLCNRFILCVDNIFREIPCAIGGRWNPQERQCQRSDSLSCAIEERQCPEFDDIDNPSHVPCLLDCNRYILLYFD